MSASLLDERGVVVACPNCGQKNRIVFEHLDDPVRCGKCSSEVSAPREPVDVPTEQVFDELIARASIPVVVDYWAEWCGPCRMVGPELAKIAQQNAGRLLVVKVNTETLPGVAARFRVQSIPMLGLFRGGQPLSETVGARPARDIQAFIDQGLGARG
ncbi:MAG TPA: thioredoxin [Vicinamibacterales bacterium]|nr:thioredoxin [Vicinamibacterales bacterium]